MGQSRIGSQRGRCSDVGGGEKEIYDATAHRNNGAPPGIPVQFFQRRMTFMSESKILKRRLLPN
jgi:hypothetical protein